MRQNVEHMEVVPLSAGCHQQITTAKYRAIVQCKVKDGQKDTHNIMKTKKP